MSLIVDGSTFFAAPYQQNNAAFEYLTLFCWVKFGSTTGAQAMLGVSGTATGNYSTSLIKSSGGNQFYAFTQGNSDTAIDATGGATLSASTWYATCVVCTLTSAIQWVGTTGTLSGTGTTGASTWNQVQLGGLQVNGGSASDILTVGTHLAECAIWGTALSPTDQNDLVFGLKSPWNVNRSGLLTYCLCARTSKTSARCI
jgi:hypothetical protein